MPNNRKVYLEITNVCNLSCSFCPGTKRRAGKLDIEQFAFLAKRVSSWAQYLYFHLMGEPTSHKLLPKFVSLSKEYGLVPVITTNGTLLSDCGDEIISSKPYKVNISLHSFEANDRDTNFEEYILDCVRFAKKASEQGIITVFRLWNLDGRAFGALHENNSYILDVLHMEFPGIWQTGRKGQKLCEYVFLEYGEKFDWPKLCADVLNENGFCYALRDQIGVLCDGTVVPCCLDKDGDLALGNLFENTLEEILSSKRAKDIYDGFSEHICSEELCKRCMRASYYRNSFGG